MKISIIITSYNLENKIEACLKSVFAQSYSDLEIIIVDDGSIDSTVKKIKSFENIHTFKFIEQENSGVSVARNVGIQNSTGDFIMFVDGDDQLESNIVDILTKEIDDETDIVACCCKNFTEKGNFEEEYFFKDSFEAIDVSSKKILFQQLMKSRVGQPTNQHFYAAIGVPWGKLYRRSFLVKNDLCFKPELRRLQDNVFNMYCFAVANKIKYINKPLYLYNVDHLSSYSKGYSPTIYYNVLEARENFWKENPKYAIDDLKNSYNQEVEFYFLNSIRNICTSQKYKNAKYSIRELKNMDIYRNRIKKEQQSRKCKIVLTLLDFKLDIVVYAYHQLKKIFHSFL